MVSTRSQEEKDRFFAHLETLGESEDESSHVGEDDVKFIKEVKVVHKTDQFVNRQGIQPTSRQLKGDPQQQIPKKYTRQTDVLKSTASLGSSHMDCVEITQVQSRKAQRSKTKDGIELVPEGNRIFAGLTFFFIPNDDVAKPRKVRIRTAISYGAVWARVFDPTVTHVIVDYRLDFNAASKALPVQQSLKDVILVRDTWLIDSIAYRNLQQPLESRFKVKGSPDIHRIQQPRQTNVTEMTTKKRKLNVADSLPTKKQSTEQEDELDKIVREVQSSSHLPVDNESFDDDLIEEPGAEDDTTAIATLLTSKAENAGFQCMEKNDGSAVDNPNARTIEILQKMCTYYDRTGDHWRTTAYRKAIGALKKQHTLISTREQAIAIPQIGGRLADKIEEIVTTDRLKSLESVQDNPDAQVLQLFMGIYGVGLVQATKWVSQGYRTLEDLTHTAKLNRNQKIGIEHYDDFQQRIPRSEVAEHGDVVQKALHKVDARLDAMIGGSYRRGSPDSGDIDIIITKRDTTMEVIRTLVLKSVIPALEKSGFLKVALATSTTQSQGSKWHGASCLPGSTTWRRIDLLFVPWSELGAALIYFTGNDIFNRSLRLLASRKGMRLNQHGLYADVMRGKGRARMTDGKLLEGHSETKIFEILGVPWRPPEHRKC